MTFGKLFGHWLISWQNATDSNRHNLLKSQGLKRKKNVHPHQFRAVQYSSGCLRPENRPSQNNWQRILQKTSLRMPYKPLMTTATIKRFCGTNGQTQPTLRDTTKPTANFT